MNRRSMKFGLLVGLTGGSLMAIWIMAASVITGNGLLTPLNLIAHTFWRGAPMGAAYSLPAILLGAAIHLTISIGIGLVLAALVEHEALDGAMVFFLALGLGMGAWVVQAFAWPSIDNAASSSTTPWIFAAAHIIFSVGAALALNRLERLSPTSPVTATTTADLRVSRP